eukprot:689118-Pleurochrysis_carterae.AAC.1
MAGTAPAPPSESVQPTDDGANDVTLQEHFQRGLGAYPLRNRSPAALFTVHVTTHPVGTTRNTG